MLYDLIKRYVYLLTSSAVGNARAAKTKFKCSNSQKMTKLYHLPSAVCFFNVSPRRPKRILYAKT